MSNSLFSHFKLVDASTLKKEVAEGVDLMVVRELTGGQCSLISLGVIWISTSKSHLFIYFLFLPMFSESDR